MEQQEQQSSEPVLPQEELSLFNEDGTPKSKNQLKNDAKRAEKLKKFAAKQEKLEVLNATKQTKSNISAAEKAKAGAEVSADDDAEAVLPGAKKNMNAPMAAAYSPKRVEAHWYAWWEACGFFTPEKCAPNDDAAADRTPYVLTIPPPNVTGSLHLGHSMMAAIQDALVRFYRMRGRPTLYVPGCDHAGIATQVVVEKKLKRERGVTRHDVGRDAFVEEVWRWKNASGARIYEQLKRMGISADWQRACFTMDPSFVAAVTRAFVSMHADGLIFRDYRLVNWSAKCQTSLSDIEVDMREIGARTLMSVVDHDPTKQYEFGVLYHLAYPVEGDAGEIVVATTRPETFFGDVAIVVNPTDERYAQFQGLHAIHPYHRTPIPIIFDEFALKDFGTGAVKITPAHDANDFRIGKTYGLPMISVLDENNFLNEQCGEFCGLKRYDGRIAVIRWFKEQGLYRGDFDAPTVLPFCSRSGDIIELRLKSQWWLNCRSMAAAACEVVRNGQLRIVPADGEREWFKWLENIQDWCLSRQLWWGHRIPVYHVDFEGERSNPDVDAFWVCGETYEEAVAAARVKFPGKSVILTQDEDVLDTWFSSGLWPFGVMGWPNVEAADMQRFFPTTILETGKDILFFWVARMVMMSLQLTKQVPFSTVLLHTIVRDAHGRKMSKSLGNIVDPIDVIEGCALETLLAQLDGGNLDPKEIAAAKDGKRKDFPIGIPECGTDALRFCLCACTNLSRDLNLDILRVEGYRKFCNKIWNATKFALLKLDGGDLVLDPVLYRVCGAESLLDRWILHRLNATVSAVVSGLESFNFMGATSAIHSFWLYDLCDVYIEAIKPICEGTDVAAKKICKAILFECLEVGLKLLHPFMPYVTEELWHRLPRRPENTTESIMIASFPIPNSTYESLQSDQDFTFVLDVVRGIRSTAAAEFGIKKGLNAKLFVSDQTKAQILSSEEPCILALIRSLSAVSISSVGIDSDTSKEAKEIVPNAASLLLIQA